MASVCPKCRASVTLVGALSVCPEHGVVTAVTEPDSPPAVAPARPRVFLSCGRADAKPLVDRLCVDLAAAGFDVWWDTREIRGGTDWQAEIVDGLRSAEA